MIRQIGIFGLIAAGSVAVATHAAPPATVTTDVSQAIAFSDIRNCIFAPKTEATFNALLHFNERGATWLTQPQVAIGTLKLATTRTITPKDDVAPGGKYFAVSVRFPADTLWHGLKLAEMKRDQGYYPDVDGFEQRQLVFLDPPARVQAVLKQMGVAVPMAPEYRDVGEDGIGAMSVAAYKGRTYLSCNWGA